MGTKRIELVTKRVGDLKTTFGNPRKIKKGKVEELKASLEAYGDFGIFLINEKDEIIAGNMRAMVLVEKDPNIEVTCKRLIGYSNSELRAINIKDNTHAGEWDVDLLADWMVDLNIDLGLDDDKDNPSEKRIKEIELIHYEKYDYVLLVANNELDYNQMLEKLGIDKNAKVSISSKKKIRGRAIWYHKSKLADKDLL